MAYKKVNSINNTSSKSTKKKGKSTNSNKKEVKEEKVKTKNSTLKTKNNIVNNKKKTPIKSNNNKNVKAKNKNTIKKTKNSSVNKRKNINNKDRFNKIIKMSPYFLVIIIVIILLLINLFKVLIWVIDEYKTVDYIKDYSEYFIMEEEENSEEVKLVNPPTDKKDDYYKYIDIPFKSVDLKSLIEINSDTVAFIHLNNTNINYPVLKTTNNDYYLNHSFNKSRNGNGWIFMDFRNNSDFTSDNTIIYGHALLNKTMFGTLKNVLSDSYLGNKENNIIFISTKDYDYMYQIFSIYYVKTETYYMTPSFNNMEEKRVWLDKIKKRNISNINTTVNENDKILTLSTCKSNSERIVVHSKLIKMQENNL